MLFLAPLLKLLICPFERNTLPKLYASHVKDGQVAFQTLLKPSTVGADLCKFMLNSHLEKVRGEQVNLNSCLRK